MSVTTKALKRPPTLSGLRQLRREFNVVLASLREARGKVNDLAVRARIDSATKEIGKRAGNLALAIDRISTLRAKQDSYSKRIADLEARIGKLLGRSYRGNSRWLRRWQNL